ncbi:MAG: acyl-CoA desaturase [Phycisphaerae bacterium]
MLYRWIDADGYAKSCATENPDEVELSRGLPLLVTHLACFGVIWTGWSVAAVSVAVFMYFLRMFAITGFYHRYFSHRSFQTSRFMQFMFGVLGNSAAQRGPLWWAAHHRHHHRHSDKEGDPHSPRLRGLWHGHFGWLMTRGAFVTDRDAVKDLVQYPELRWLDRFDLAVPFLLAVGMYGLGAILEAYAPSLGTNGWQMLVWGFFISTVVLLHGTCTINSLAHWMGGRRFNTDDDSRNSFVLALITLGEGWHNNHHRFPGAVRQGMYWWELDLTYLGLRLMQAMGLVWKLTPHPAHAYLPQTRESAADDRSTTGVTQSAS